MSLQRLVVAVLVAVVSLTSSFTINDDEADELPEMLQPIVRGGSWFDDMAVDRLEEKHDKLESEGRLDEHVHEVDSEEMFIIRKLGLVKNGTKHHEHKKAEHVSHHASSRDRVHTSISKIQDSVEEEKSQKEALNVGGKVSKKNKQDIHGPMTTEQFMALYEKELQGFFRKFMVVMSQATIGGGVSRGVIIERRIDSDIKEAESGSRTNDLQS